MVDTRPLRYDQNCGQCFIHTYTIILFKGLFNTIFGNVKLWSVFCTHNTSQWLCVSVVDKCLDGKMEFTTPIADDIIVV